MTAFSTKEWKIHGTIIDLDKRNDLILITDSQCVADVLESIGQFDCMDENVSLFVKAENGEYTEIYMFRGIVAYLYKTVWRYTWEK
ncbi:MAG: hypothetical protein ACP5D6_06395 [Kosmotogaceae bacterium]